MDDDGGKDALRAAALAERATIAPGTWRAEDTARTRHLLDHAAGLPRGVAAVYASRAAEPSTVEVIDGLIGQGWRVLLPVIRREVDWAEFTGWGDTVEGWGSIPQPTGLRLGTGALADASLILVSALAVGRDWTRLGTGGGWYDKALTHRAPTAQIIAITREAEVHATVPTLPHDVAIHGYATEARLALR